MDDLNHTLYLWLNASTQPPVLLLDAAKILAEYFIWIIPALIGFGWLRGDTGTRQRLLIASVAGLTGLLINQLIGFFYLHPRPFMIGLGHTLITHATDSSFPSDHLTLWWSVAFSMTLSARCRATGLLLTLLGLPIAWARIYLGVHFPFDMIGSSIVALLCTWTAERAAGIYLPITMTLAQRVHGRLFAGLIRRGWVHE